MVVESDDEDDGKERETRWVDQILRLKCEFGEDCDRSATLAHFVADHAMEFKGDGNDVYSREHESRHALLYKEYLALWECEMEEFCKRRDIGLVELQSQMSDALNDRYTALFEEHPHHGWVDSALAALSYEHFYERMTKAADAASSSCEEKHCHK